MEILRRSRLIPQLFKIISDLSAASKLNNNEWRFRYVTDENYYPLTKEEIKKHVPLSPGAYNKAVKTPVDEMKTLSGIPIYETYPNSLEIQTIQHAAGIDTTKPR